MSKYCEEGWRQGRDQNKHRRRGQKGESDRGKEGDTRGFGCVISTELW